MGKIDKLKITCCQCGKDANSIIYYKEGKFSVCDDCMNNKNTFTNLFKQGKI